MFALIEPMPAGNAVRIILSPPSGAAEWKVLRRASDSITGPDDAGAVLVADWGRYEGIIDDDGLVNGTAAYYRVFYRDAAGAPILPHGPAQSVTPAATARDTSPSPLRILRRRLELGLAAAVAEGRLTPRSGKVPIVVAPMVDPGKISFPIVSIHLDRDAPAERAVAEFLFEDATADGFDDTHGYLSEVSINVVAVSLNPDERLTLGEVLKHIVLSNHPVFLAHGLMRPSASLAHSEMAPDQNATPLYVAALTFTCLAPSQFTAAAPVITDATATVMEIAP